MEAPVRGAFRSAYLVAALSTRTQFAAAPAALAQQIGALTVKTQFNATLSAIALTQDRIPAPRGIAMQVRVNLETMTADGSARSCQVTATQYQRNE